jgi:hypothetical protein
VFEVKSKLAEYYEVGSYRKNGYDLWKENEKSLHSVLYGHPKWTDKFIELIGPYESGKTTLCMKLVANHLALHPGDTAIWLDIRKQFATRRFFDILNTECPSSDAEVCAKYCFFHMQVFQIAYKYLY